MHLRSVLLSGVLAPLNLTAACNPLMCIDLVLCGAERRYFPALGSHAEQPSPRLSASARWYMATLESGLLTTSLVRGWSCHPAAAVFRQRGWEHAVLQQMCSNEPCEAAVAAYKGREAPIVARFRLQVLQDAGMSKAAVALASTMGGDAQASTLTRAP